MAKSSGNLVAQLSSFPAESTREFEEAAVQLIKDLSAEHISGLEDTALDSALSLEGRYAALFTYATYLRRQGQYTKLLAFLESHKSEFGGFGTFHHLSAMALAGRGDSHDLQLAIASALKARELLPRHAGVLHNYALLRVADLEERIPLSEIAREPDHLASIGEADDALSQALVERPRYAKFQSTLARLESVRGRHQEAQRIMARALDLEDPASPDFSLRIVSYNQILSRIVMRQALNTVAQETSEAASAAREAKSSVQSFVDQMQTRYLELLGIFAAIIGIVLTGVQVATNLEFSDGARLMLVVTGSMLVLFSAIESVVQRPLKYVVALGVSGITVIALGFLSGLLPL